MSSVTYTASPTSVRFQLPPLTSASTPYSVLYAVGASTVDTGGSNAASPESIWTFSNLLPATLYTFHTYTVSKGVKTLRYTTAVTTPTAILSSFAKTALPGSTLSPNISTIKTTNSLTPEAIVQSLFTSGDKVSVRSSTSADTGKASTVSAAVQNPGSTFLLQKNARVYIPFDSTVATAQSVTATLSNNSTATITYNKASNSITIGANTYTVGQKFLLDGQYVTVGTA